MSKGAERVAGVQKLTPRPRQRHFDPVPRALGVANTFGYPRAIHNAARRKDEICPFFTKRTATPKSEVPRYTGRGTGSLPRFIGDLSVMFMARSDFRTPVEAIGLPQSEMAMPRHGL